RMPGIIGWIAGGYLGVLLLLFVAQRALMYHPSKIVPDPEVYGASDMQIVELQTEDGLKLHSWWKPPSRPDKATIVYFHGNAGNIGDRAFKARHYLDDGYGVLLMSYRYNAGAGGKPSEEGLYKDGQAAYDFVRSQGVPADRIVVYGESLGSGVATTVATTNEVGAVVLEAPYTRIGDVAQTHYWYVPAKWLMLDKYDSIGRIADLKVPLLILHGESDRLIPVKFGRELFEAAREPKEAHFVPGGGHADLYDFGIDRVILDFLGRKLPQRAAAD
ncbi:MAG: alpha/beta hydrolase, partial [Pseudomonadota bacterium]